MNKSDNLKLAEVKNFKKSVLFVTGFAAFLIPFLSSSVNLALPAIGKDLGANAVSLGWVISSFILSSSIFLLPFGRLADIVGRKKIFLTGTILFTLSTFLIVFTKEIQTLILFRVFQGFSGAMIFGTSMAITTSVFQQGERGRAMGINVTAVYIGLSTGPVFGGLLTQHFGWRSIFLFLVPFELISAYLISTKIKGEWAEAKGEKFDWKGSLIYGVSLFALMYGFSKLPEAKGWICVSIGLALLFSFILFEKTTESPVFDIKLLLKNRVFAFSGIAALINYSATSAIGFFISLYLQYIKGLDARSAGLIMISQPVVMALLSPLAGKLSDKKDPGVIASFGMGIIAVGLLFLCFITENTPSYFIVIMLLLLGTGFAFFSSPNSNAIMSSVEKKSFGVASGVIATMRMIGQMMSMAIAMMLISVYIGSQEIIASTHKGLIAGMKTAFIVFSALSILGIFASLARNNKAGNKIYN
jgi:EmrB/QacA subfamily drug resistance transporter